jgi:hypothetical protein
MYDSGYRGGFKDGVLNMSTACLMEQEYVCHPLTNIINQTIIQKVYVDRNITIKEVCPELVCPGCPVCDVIEGNGLSASINKKLLNCHSKDGSTVYQAGYSDCCDDMREDLNVPGRPKFKTRPKVGMEFTYDKSLDVKTCFVGDMIVFNRTGVGDNQSGYWRWNDEECLGSVLRIYHN